MGMRRFMIAGVRIGIVKAKSSKLKAQSQKLKAKSVVLKSNLRFCHPAVLSFTEVTGIDFFGHWWYNEWVVCFL